MQQQARKSHLIAGVVMGIVFLAFAITEYYSRSWEVWVLFTLVRVAGVACIMTVAFCTWRFRWHPNLLAYVYSILIPVFISWVYYNTPVGEGRGVLSALTIVYLASGFTVLWHWAHSLLVALVVTTIHSSLTLSQTELKTFMTEGGLWTFVMPFAVIGLVVYRYQFVKREIMLRLALQEKNEEIHQQAEELQTQNTQIEEQRRALSTAYHQITGSVRYAMRIQEALRPSQEHLEHFCKENFVLSKAKDSISGDFYWLSEHGTRHFLAVADCTGHGVPGGFMTMLGYSMLNQLINNEHTDDPGAILEEMDRRLLRLLRQEQDAQVKIADGMDIALLRRDADQLVFAGARRPLWLFSGGRLQEFKGCRFPIGDNFFSQKQFKSQTIPYQPGDVVYLFSDGYADQFGSSDKKFLIARFRTLLTEIHTLPMPVQQNILVEQMAQWQGNMPQTDDWLIAGMRL